ncbi:TetR/AcrR family transcriptional regulator [Methylovirgula sp. 4M-Z18]|uniref:TetR/AcrR family transcriptional regulator n=2 Tax=Methylovirgula sp. 4M-Z18 TaxID=2293567 RepID=UPI0032B01AD7
MVCQYKTEPTSFLLARLNMAEDCHIKGSGTTAERITMSLTTNLSPNSLEHGDAAPKIGRKWAQVESVARRLFLEHGFMNTSMDAVARDAMVSKATLYAYFPSKEALFAHLIAQECNEKQERLQILDLNTHDLETALRSFAHDYVRIFLDDDKMAFFRVVSAENARFPALCHLFFEAGPGNNIRRIATFLDDAKARGLLEFENSCIAATQFVSLVRGELPLCTALGIHRPTEDEIAEVIDSGLAVFLRAYAPRTQRDKENSARRVDDAAA